MQLRQQAPVELTMLNDDCLLLICAQLSIKDQFVLLQAGGRLQQLVLRIWQRKYASEFDWQKEIQLKLLDKEEQSELLGHMAMLTRALLNLSHSDELLAWTRSKAQRKRLPHMQRLGFQQCNTALLRQLPTICCNIVQLQLGSCLHITPADLSQLFCQLPQLSVFELLPGSLCNAKAAALADIEFGQILQTVALPACALRATASKIARLPQLRQLTGFLCCCSSGIDEDKEKANGGGTTATATIYACLKVLSGGGGSGGAACKIVSLHLQCQLDVSLPRLLLLQQHLSVLRLERFAWHSQLMVHYDALDGSIKWLPQQPQVSRAILQFIVSQLTSLYELDLTRNVHATPTFVAQLAEHFLPDSERKLKLAVWHDACPRPRMSNEKAYKDANRNDLAFVKFELKYFNNENMN